MQYSKWNTQTYIEHLLVASYMDFYAPNLLDRMSENDFNVINNIKKGMCFTLRELRNNENFLILLKKFNKKKV